jgi:hypothetical protein
MPNTHNKSNSFRSQPSHILKVPKVSQLILRNKKSHLLCAPYSVNKFAAVEMDGVRKSCRAVCSVDRRRLFLRAALLVCCFINSTVYIRARSRYVSGRRTHTQDQLFPAASNGAWSVYVGIGVSAKTIKTLG